MTISAPLSSALDDRDINARRRLFIVGAGSAAVFAVGMIPGARLNAEPISLSTAINRSGKLRALSQRTAKAYTQMALGILPERAYEIIVASQALIQRSIQELQLLGGTPELGRALAILDGEAKKLIVSTSKNAVRTDALDISILSDQVLKEAEKTTHYYQTLAKSVQAKIVNVAGRQRMLSQRTAKYYMLIQAGYDSKVVRSEMAKSRSEFNAAMEMLINAPVSTPSIRSELELAKQQWSVFQGALDLPPNPTMVRNVATTSERVLEVMDGLTNQYDTALKDILGATDEGKKFLALSS